MEDSRQGITAQRLKSLRMQMGLSHKEVESRTKEMGIYTVSKTVLHDLEDEYFSDRKFACQAFIALSALYGVSVDYLLGLSDTKSPSVSVQTACRTTGLSEEAVNALIEANRKPREMEVLNTLIASPQFWTALGSMAQFVNVFVSGLASPCMVSDPEHYTTRELDTLGLTPIWKTTAARLHLEDAAADIRAILEAVAKEQVKGKNAAAIREAAQFEELPEIEIGSPEWMQLHGDQFNPDGTARETQSRAVDSQKQKKPPASSGQGQEGDINGEQ